MSPKIDCKFGALAFAMIPAAQADTVGLVNGDRLSGRLVRMDAAHLWLETHYAGTLKLERAQVRSIETDAPVRLRLADGTELDGELQPAEAGMFSARIADLARTAPLPIGRVAAINPPRHPDRTVLSGRAAVGGSVARGNTDTRMLHLDGELVARNPTQRVTLDVKANRASQDGVETANNWRLGMKYDHFLNERTYFYANSRFDHDAQADLDLRSTLGIGAGRQLFDRSDLKLSVEGGLSLVNEDYGSAPDERFPGARAALKYEQGLWENRLRLFHSGDLLVSLESLDDYLYQSRTGIRVPMGNGLSLGAQLNVDYDNVPAPGKQTTDTALIFKMDYTL